MIKAIEVIKMRKNIKHLIDKYFFSKSLLAEALEVCPKVISDLIDKEVMPQDDKFISLHNKIKTIKEQIKEAEEYQPGETK
jgi:predicted XRE-type DNA-binding protein